MNAIYKQLFKERLTNVPLISKKGCTTKFHFCKERLYFCKSAKNTRSITYTPKSMGTKLEDLFEEFVSQFEDLSKSISKVGSSYELETEFNSLFKKFGHDRYQGMIGKIPKSKNDRTTILTSIGDVSFPISHPLATAPNTIPRVHKYWIFTIVRNTFLLLQRHTAPKMKTQPKNGLTPALIP